MAWARRRFSALIGDSWWRMVVLMRPASTQSATRFSKTVLLDHVVGLEHRAGEHQLPRKRDALVLQDAQVQGASRLDDRQHRPLRPHDVWQRRPVTAGVVEQ